MTAIPDYVRAALAERYVLERELGQGGMATVYLAQDPKHQRRVAVKVLRPELAIALGPQRFLREIQIAAGLVHPHILALHDSGQVGGLLYYVMPFVEGESLRARLEREGPLGLKDALQLAQQVLAALGYAHAHGILHRDIKPENILLEGDQALVADFGIARAVSEAGGERLTETGMTLGTPAYMSPEQASAEARLDGRSDLYSVGCVLYEMLAGEPPFTGPSAQAVIARHRAEQPRSLRVVRPDLPATVETAVETALAKAPAARFRSAAEFARALTGPEGVRAEPERKQAGPQGRAILVLGVLALTLLLGVAIPMARARRPALDPRRVVVAPFENRTGDPTLGTVAAMAADWITRGLTETGLVDVADPRSVGAPLMAGTGTSPHRLAEAVAAGSAVAGSVYRQGDSLQFSAQIIDANTREIARSVPPVAAPMAAPLTGIEKLRDRVMASLATLVDSASAGSWPQTASQPPTFEAYREYLEGIAAGQRAQIREALRHWDRAARLDSSFTWPLVAAAAGYWNLDDCAAVDSIGRVLEARGDQLAPYDRHAVTRRVAICRGDKAASYRASRDLVRLAPHSEGARLTLAQASIEISRPREAVSLLEQLDRERDGVHGDWGYYTTLAMALHMLGDHRRELKISRHGRRQRSDPTWQLALLFRGEVRALAALGRVDDLMARLDESLALPEQPFPTPGRIMLIAASELQAHGHAEAAKPVWQRAAAWFRSHPPPEKSEASPMRRVTPVWALYGAGDFEAAESAAARLAADDPEKVEYQGWLGILAARQGRRVEAERIAAELARREGPYLRGRHTAARAAIAASLGEREQAVALLEQAFTQGVMYYVGPALQSLHAEPGFESLRGYPPFEALLRPKG